MAGLWVLKIESGGNTWCGDEKQQVISPYGGILVSNACRASTMQIVLRK